MKLLKMQVYFTPTSCMNKTWEVAYFDDTRTTYRRAWIQISVDQCELFYYSLNDQMNSAQKYFFPYVRLLHLSCIILS